MAKRKWSERGSGEHHWSRTRIMQKRWDDPIQRERMLQHIKDMTTKRVAKGRDGTRFGVFDGMRRAEAEQVWAQARAKAEEIVNKMADKGIFDDGADPVDRERAEQAMKEAIAVMATPSNQQLKLAAASLILSYTKSKPVAKHAHQINAAEQWLKAVSEDNDEPEAAGDTEASG